MRGSSVRVARLAVAAGIAGILAAGAAPALAENGISHFSGSASGQAIGLQVNPNSVLDVKLNAVQNLINKLPLGANQTLGRAVGSTLANPTAPINVTVDSATAQGVSTDGLHLAAGTVEHPTKAHSTAVAIDAKSLADEVALINQMVKNMPDGTVQALQDVLGPIAAAEQAQLHTSTLSNVLTQYLPTLSHPITGALGSPTVDLLRSVDANFGDDVTGDITTVQKGGVLTPNSTLSLQPFEARALPSDAFATNAVDNLALVPGTNGLGLVDNNQLALSLDNLDKVLVAVEKTLSAASSNLGVKGVVDPLTGLVFPVLNGTAGTASGTLKSVDLNAVNALVNRISGLVDTLNGLSGLQLNDIVGNNGSNAVSSLSRTGDSVTANGLGQVAHVDVLKINDTHLQQLLGTTELASVDGIKATTAVSLDGVHNANQSANGTLVDVRLLGKSLTTYAAAAGQTVALDDILPPGTTCSIKLPGASTCHGIQLKVVPSAVSAQLQTLEDTLSSAGAGISPLLTVNLTRGLGVVDQSGSARYGRADITVLQVNTDINCATVQQVSGLLNRATQGALSTAQSTLASALDLHLAACGLGITETPAGAGAARAHAAAAPRAAADGNDVHLVSLNLGVAHAEVSLDTNTSGCTTNCDTQSGPLTPTTGNDLLILAGMAVVAMAAGISLQA
ncbi:MAG: hypothetical protein M3010_05325, partial [Candidatus Dormibacteraeota bacterium]|nr:hypothetical protein [Candidatus Dormibacteraeota bacterium]